MDLPRARPVDEHAYVGPGEADRRRGTRQRVANLLAAGFGWAAGAASLTWHISLWWSIAFGSAVIVALVVAHRRRRRSTRVDRDA
ncbi:MAG TPA: hypothetical protein VMV41_00350 [Cellulomonadaceae bacterium]|nr:hypothetical protein [Cellulomonadaceae bacterium]